MRSGTYCPCKKPNDKLYYVHTLSNHPPQIIRQLSFSISERLCNSSSNEIDEVKIYKSTLKYKLKNTPGKNKNRRSNIIWFNASFRKHATINAAKSFFRLLDKYFPKSNRLHKIFKRKWLYMENGSQITKRYNKRVTKTDERS